MPMSFRSKPEPPTETTPTEPPVEALTEGPPAREEPPTAIPQIATPPIATPQISTQPHSTVTMTSESFQMVQLMAAMVELLQRNAAAQPQPPAPVYRPKELLRTSAGEPQDDPEVFIAEVEFYFQQVGECNLTPRHRVLVAHRQLRGDAAKRNKYYRDEDTSVEELWVRLRRDYGTENQFTRLLIAFTGATFRQNEPLGEFVNRQTKLYRRLFLGSPESRIVKELIQQMPSSVRSTLAVGIYGYKRDLLGGSRRKEEESVGKLASGCSKVSYSARCFVLNHDDTINSPKYQHYWSARSSRPPWTRGHPQILSTVASSNPRPGRRPPYSWQARTVPSRPPAPHTQGDYRRPDAGFIGTGFLSAAPPKFPAGPIRSRPWRLGLQPGAYKYSVHIV
jgi:hypothetical protein